MYGSFVKGSQAGDQDMHKEDMQYYIAIVREDIGKIGARIDVIVGQTSS